jgi:hypothetical protein
MAVKIGTNELKAPVRPKVKDQDTERAIRELQDKITELQAIVRRIASA